MFLHRGSETRRVINTIVEKTLQRDITSSESGKVSSETD